MPTPPQAELAAWSPPLLATFALVLAALVYAWGWFHLRKSYPGAIPAWRLGAFMGGLFSLWIAVGSPLTAFDDDLLTIHMVQHVLLMAVAPPLILLGAPALPFLHGLPQRFVRSVLGPVLRWPPIEWLGRIATRPVICWLAAMIALIGWHLPALFELGLRFQLWHEVEHACFFSTGLLFWWPVIQPWPSVAKVPRWSIPLYLFLATLPCDALSAFLAFCDRVVYPSYLSTPPVFSLTPLQDQECAGALMWVCATFIYLIPAVVITVQILSPQGLHIRNQDGSSFANESSHARMNPRKTELG
ncbi:MAG: cytochrome c oxidase assembly protein [Terriglobia bacterium]